METTNERVQVNLKMLINLARSAALLKLTKTKVKAQQSGGYISRIKGRGMEFDEVRPYQAGDDIRSIDWRVTARTGKTHTKLFREERERPVFISVDYRQGMQFATRGVFKSVQAAKLAAVLAWVAQKQGDRLGGQIFTDTSCRELKPSNGRPAVLHFLNALVKAIPAQQALSFEQVISRLSQHVKPGNLVYIVSDFRGINSACELSLAKLAKHCDVVMIFIYDPLESKLPPKGRFRFTHQQQECLVDTSNKKRLLAYQNNFQQHQTELQRIATQLNIRLICCGTPEKVTDILR